MGVDNSAEIKLALTQAFVDKLSNIAMSERKLGKTLVRSVNFFGRTVDENVSVRDLYLPSWHHFRAPEEQESPLYSLALKLPERLVTSWNQGITMFVVRFFMTGSKNTFLLSDLRTRRDLIPGVTLEHRKTALIRAAFVRPQTKISQS